MPDKYRVELLFEDMEGKGNHLQILLIVKILKSEQKNGRKTAGKQKRAKPLTCLTL